jgi:regulation of enolase protein 1 (concanavalin A-like superfamily)
MTDFWRKTHNGLIRDNGHFYFRQITGDFTARVKFSGRYTALYDQAGLMVRADEANWLKCGIEFVEDIQYVSAVVTRDYSDWSVGSLPQNLPALWIRVSRQGTTMEVHYALDGADYTMLRTTYLTSADSVGVGLMCASPEGDGFAVTFEDLTIDSP